jgi:glutamate/tyrosine decarboxylase-like PLP-dependent enzyme
MNPTPQAAAAGDRLSPPNARSAPIDLSAETFRAMGHKLVDDVAELLATLRDRQVAPGAEPADLRALLPRGGIPESGADPQVLLRETTRLLLEHSTFNGHPRFFGYITAGPAPIGILADMLASAVNPNVGAWSLSPIASEIERQSLRWIAELIGYPTSSGGIFVSGGNVANIICLLAARAAVTAWDVKTDGARPAGESRQLVLYTSKETHTWINKAADICGLGTKAIRWIPIDTKGRMRVDALRDAITRDREDGALPFLVIGTAGTTNTGAIDPLSEIGAVAREAGLWFHVDGAYGAPVVALPDAPADLRALADADSVAVDPHKWLYAPLEAGCALVRDRDALHRTFLQAAPPYYHFEDNDQDPPINYYEWGFQNSRGFRALKVWLALRQVGREGYVRMIADDIALTRTLFGAVAAHADLEAVTCELSIATFAYVPRDLRASLAGGPQRETVLEYVNELNSAILTKTQHDGGVYLSNAVVDGRFLLRSCIVNFRTERDDVLAVPEIIAQAGRALDRKMRPADLR